MFPVKQLQNYTDPFWFVIPMNSRLLTLLFAGAALAAAAADPSAPTPNLTPAQTPAPNRAQTPAHPPLLTAATGPRIEFATPVYDFGKITAGEVVKHDFVFTNIGTSILTISQVKPGCGCTTAGTWNRTVEPGKTGVIPIQYHASSSSGTIWKSILVSCNDVAHSNIFLQIKGNIWTPVSITPATAYFNFASDATTNETRVLKITSHLDAPLEFVGSPQETNDAFQVELKPLSPGKEYELRVTADPTKIAATVNAPVVLKSSTQSLPELRVPVMAFVRPAVSLVPALVRVPIGKPAEASTSVVTIHNISARPLELSEPTINLEGAKLDIQELQTGKVFRVTFHLPADATLVPGQRFEAKIKTNHPKQPTIRIPVVAITRPVAAAAAPRRVQLHPNPVPAGGIPPAPAPPVGPGPFRGTNR